MMLKTYFQVSIRINGDMITSRVTHLPAFEDAHLAMQFIDLYITGYHGKLEELSFDVSPMEFAEEEQ